MKTHKNNYVLKGIIGLLALSLFLIAIVACGGTPEPTAAPTSAPAQPTTASAQPTAAPKPTDAPKPTQASSTSLLSNQPALGNFGNGGETPPGQATNVTLPTVPPTGNRIADSKFRPEVDGLPFENYVNDPGIINMTPEDMQKLFGDAVCASKADGKCTLTPPAQQWMETTNTAMGGGHCYGMSVTALRAWKAQVTLADLGGTGDVQGLALKGNEKLMRDIAASWAFQKFDSVRAGALVGTPNGILKFLIDFLNQGKGAQETYTIGFFKIEGGGGHAVTPYAVEDRGNGMFALLVWDNNFPKVQREMIFDANKNMWYYSAAINPNEPAGLYYGTAESKSLFLFPTNPGLAPQACAFCAATSGRIGGGLAATGPTYNYIYLESDPKNHPHLLITAEDGKRIGYTGDGKFVNEIPGAQIERDLVSGMYAPDTHAQADEPTYKIPSNIKFTLTIDGTNLKQDAKANVLLLGPGYDVGLDGITFKPGDKDTLALAPDGSKLVYTTTGSESPDIIIGIEHKGADYSFALKGVDLDGGGVLTASLDYTKGELRLSTTGTKKPGTYGIAMSRIDDKGEQVFFHDGVELDPGDTAVLEFGKWSGDKGALQLGIDRGSKGTITETLDLTDAN